MRRRAGDPLGLAYNQGMYAPSLGWAGRLALLSLVAGPALGVACRGRADDPVILRLGDQVVRRSAFQGHLEALAARGSDTSQPAVRRALLDKFLEDRTLVLEARARGMLGASAPAEEEERAVQRLLAEVVSSQPGPTQAEIDAYYRNHSDEFRIPETVTVRQILVPTENEARDIRRRVRNDPKNFEILARTLSHSPEAAQGGLLGEFARGQLPAELDRVVFSLPPGAQTEIVVTPHGHHVVRVEARTAERLLTLDECRTRVRAAAARRAQDELVQRFIRDLLARAKVDHEAAEIPVPRS